MVSERNRVVGLINYLEQNGVVVNFGKNKARGNKGFFRVKNDVYRIDVSKEIPEREQYRVLLHEFAHYIHYSQDKTLKSLSFIFEEMNDEIIDELINLTVDLIPKETVKPVYDLKDKLTKELNDIVNALKNKHFEFKVADVNVDFERRIKAKGLAPLLKYDRVKVFNFFTYKKYDISNVEKYFSSAEEELILYLKLKSKQRALKRINSRISRLNKYYNSPTELFARAFEMYFLYPDKTKEIAPNVYSGFVELITEDRIKLLSNCKVLFD